MERPLAWLARFGRHLPFAIAALPALAYAIRTTHDLVWPYDVDFFREIAQAQVFADGAWGAEPFYLDQRLWYPPLGPALVAVSARLTDLPVPLVYARIGSYVNLLAPLFLYLLASRIFGRLAGFVAVVDYIYLRPLWIPGWAAGTYSPWLFSGSFAQDFAIGGLFAYHAACTRPAGWRSAVAGAFLALSALAHPSAGLILAAVMAGGGLIQLWSRTSRRVVLRCHVEVALWATLIGAPYLAVLAGHEWHGAVNTVPARWLWSGFRNSATVVAQLNVSLLLAPAGLLALLLRERRRLGGQLALVWTGASTALLLTSLIVPLLPAHHLVASLRGSLSLLVGLGAAVILRGALRRLPVDFQERSWLSAVAALVVIVALLPSYPRRRDYWQGRLLSQRRAHRRNQMQAYQWLREHGDSRMVVLASDEFSMNVVGPAGRKVVAVPSLWASPFVDNERRRVDRRRMLSALASGAEPLFCDLASEYAVTHVMWARREGSPPAQGMRHLLRHVFDNGKIRIDELRGCSRNYPERPRAMYHRGRARGRRAGATVPSDVVAASWRGSDAGGACSARTCRSAA